MDTDLNALRAKLARIDYDFSQFSPATFGDWVSRHRGRPIHLTPWSGMPKTVFGLWFTYLEEELIFYDQTIPPVLQTVTILHELSHIFLNHSTLVFTAEAELRNFLQCLKEGCLPGTPVAMQRITPGKSREEAEAEAFAVLLYQQVDRRRQVVAAPLLPGRAYLKAMGVL